MSESGITVTYSGSDALLDSAAFSQLIGTFSHHLPLRNLHWKPSASFSSSSNGATSSPFNSSLPHPTSIRTIQSLNVRLEPIADIVLRTKLKPETRHLIQRTLLERPFCHLYFVVCDDSDTYRSQIRNDIRSWLSTIQNSPTLSAATVTAKGFQGIEGLHHHKNGSASSLNNNGSSTPDVRPDTPTKDAMVEETTSPSKEKLPPPSPEYLIVVITPPDGTSLPLSAPSAKGSPASVTSRLPNVRSPGEAPIAAKSGPARFFSSSSTSKGSVIDKVKADFNTSRRERVVHLTRLPQLSSDKPSLVGYADPTIFAELQTRLKECVSGTFDAVVEMQGEVVKREGQKRNVPGWNFCKWMAGMECVASTFEGVGLVSDALAQYEEIEAAFLQCLQDRNLPFFSHVGGTTAGDDSAPLLDTTKKNYRELILRNEITLFDFRGYIFAKRASLLGKLGRVSQVMYETPVFLSRVAAMLQGESLPRHFLESWTFSCSLDVVEQCQAWLVERGDVSAPGQEYDMEDADPSTSRSIQLSAAFHSAKAELLDLARRQLDRIGIDVGHLPNAMPFILSLPHGSVASNRELPPLPDEAGQDQQVKAISGAKFTRSELLSAVESREIFDLHYISLTERVLASWTSGGRRRNVLRLRCVLGSLDFYRERFAQAYSKFTVLPESYSEHDWSVIEASHLAKQLECHARLDKTHDRAWVSVVVALLEICPKRFLGKTQKQSEDSSIRWLDPFYLYSQLRQQTQAFPQEVPLNKFNPIHIEIKDQVAQIAGGTSQDGTQITASVDNRSSCFVEVDDIRVCLVNGAGKEMWFVSGKVSLIQGINDVALSCSLFSQPGKYMVDVSQIRLSKVIVQYLHRKPKDSSKNANFVDVLEDGDALQVGMELSRKVWLDQSRICTMSIWTGRYDMQRLAIRLMNKDSGTHVKGLLDATLEQEMGSELISLTVNQEEQEIVLADLPAQTLVKLSMPLHDFSGAADGILAFLAELDYYNRTDKQIAPSRKRQVRTDVSLSVGLPLGVNVQDFFRSDRLFSKFIISAGTGGLLRLGNVHLECDGLPSNEEAPFEILNAIQKSNTVVTPTQAASYLFAIRRLKSKTTGPINRNLRLTLSFRTLLDEAIEVVLYQLECVLIRSSESEESISIALKRCLERALTSYVTTQADMSAYFFKGRLEFAARSKRQWKQIFRQWAGLLGQKQEDRIQQIVDETLLASKEDGGSTLDKETQVRWRELSLIVDVPRMKIVNAVTVQLGEKSDSVRVGQVVKAKITIETSFYWDDDDDDERIDEVKEKQQKVAEVNDQSAKEIKGGEEEEEEDEDDAASFQDAQSEASAGEREGSRSRSRSRSPLPLNKKGSTALSTKSAVLPSSNSPLPSIALSIDIHCDFVNWLLVGSKRTVIKISPNQRNSPEEDIETTWSEIDFSLIAIKSGTLCLPSVTIWPLADPVEITPPSQAHRDKESNAIQYEQEKKRLDQVQSITCDSHITNEAETVIVLPALQGAERKTYWMNL